MPQQNERPCFVTDYFVSDIDYSEARTILDITTTKQKQLRRQRSQALYTQLLLKRTYTNVCELLDSDCSLKKPLPLSTVDTNKRKLPSSSDDEMKSMNKKSRNHTEKCYDNEILQFLLELNSVKVTARY